MTRYAADTSVSVEKSKAELEQTLARYGADKFAYMTEKDRATVGFELEARAVKFVLPMPDRDDPEFHTTPGGRRRRNADSALIAWEQACRQRWRALNLCVKAKLEAVEAGIATFEEEFLAHLVLPGGKTVYEQIQPQYAKAIANGKPPKLLLEGPA